MKRLDWKKKKNEFHTHTLLRSLVISRLGRSGDKKIINKARIMLKTDKVNPDIRGAVYSIIATHGSMKEYKIFIEKYKKETLHEEKNRIGSALGDFKQDKILCEVANFALSENVRVQDTVGILSGIGANPEGRDIWLKCIKYNWKTLVSRYGDGGHTLARLVKAISGSAEEKHLKSFREFFATHDAPSAKRSIQQVLERLEGNIAWLKRDGKKIERFLK
jgi:aminopeptidase N